MRMHLLRTALCLSLAAALTSSAHAGVRGKPAQLKKPAAAAPANRVAQSDSAYTTSDTAVVPLPAEPAPIVESAPIATPECRCAKPAAPMNMNYVAVPMMMPTMSTPMMVAPMMPAPMMAAPPYTAMHSGMTSASTAGYFDAFGPGVYRTGAESGMNHYPYYSYRRPWYFPGQPSFHRSTDYVW